MSEFLPLRTKLKRAGTGEEDNFVPSYLPETLAAARDSREDFEKVQCYMAYMDVCVCTCFVSRDH